MSLHYDLNRSGVVISVRMTVAEARRLARLARSRGHFVGREHGEPVWRFTCPLTGIVGAGGRHDVLVYHLAWETPSAPKIDAAFVEHFTDPMSHEDGGRCPHVTD